MLDPVQPWEFENGLLPPWKIWKADVWSDSPSSEWSVLWYTGKTNGLRPNFQGKNIILRFGNDDMKRSRVFLITMVVLFINLLTVCTTNTQASTGVSLVLPVAYHFSVCLVSTLALRATPVTGPGAPKKQVILVCSSDRKPIATENHLRKQQGTIRIRGFPLSVKIVHEILC